MKKSICFLIICLCSITIKASMNDIVQSIDVEPREECDTESTVETNNQGRNRSLNSIVAIVNNVPITNYDHQTRKNLIKIMNNLDNLDSNQDAELSKAALENVIEEQLILQYGKKTNKVTSQRQIDEALNNIEQSNKMPKGGLIYFITSKGGDPEDFKNKIKADIIKMGILSQVKDTININANEINTTILEGAHKDLTVEALVFVSCDKNPNTYDKMNYLQNKLKTCDTVQDKWYTDFANQQTINAKLSTLESPLQSFLMDLESNKASSVFETSEGFKILLVCKKIMDPITTQEKELVMDFLTNKKVNKKALKLFADMQKNASIKRLKQY